MSPKIDWGVLEGINGRSFLTLQDFTFKEIECFLNLADALKERRRTHKAEGEVGDLLKGLNAVLIFEKDSTRTRCAFENAMYDEGGNCTYLSGGHLGKKESVEDTARVLGSMYQGIEFRGYSQNDVLTLAKFSGVSVWNGLTDEYHPTQFLADAMTMRECIDKKLSDMKVVYVGDACNNVSNSLMIGCAKMGMRFACLAPKERWPEEDLLENMREIASKAGGSIECYTIDNMKDALNDADCIYSDVWVSMGEEDLFEERIKLLKAYQVTMDMVKLANEQCIFLHCLPAFHDQETKVGRDVFKLYGLKEMEVTDEVFRSRHCKAFQQAENRMHTIKSVVVSTIAPKKKLKATFSDA